MHDELVKRLRNEAKCPDNYPEDSNLMREAADAIEELSKQLDDMNEANIALYGALPKWISVLDEDPPVGKRVLVTYNFSGSLHIETDKLLANGSWLSLGNVTHWMPLPELPKEE